MISPDSYSQRDGPSSSMRRHGTVCRPPPATSSACACASRWISRNGMVMPRRSMARRVLEQYGHPLKWYRVSFRAALSAAICCCGVRWIFAEPVAERRCARKLFSQGRMITGSRNNPAGFAIRSRDEVEHSRKERAWKLPGSLCCSMVCSRCPARLGHHVCRDAAWVPAPLEDKRGQPRTALDRLSGVEDAR